MDTALTVPPEKKTRKQRKIAVAIFAPCMKIIMQDKSIVLVPMDKVSSDAQRSILVSKARTFVEEQLERLSKVGLTPAEVKDLVKAVSDVDALQREQYVAALNNVSTTAFGKDIQGVIRNAAQGAAEGTAATFIDRYRKLDEAAKKAEEAKKVVPV